MTVESSSQAEPPKGRLATGTLKRLVALAVTGVVITGAYLAFGDRLSFDYLIEQEAAIGEAKRAYPILMLGAAFLVYVAVAAASLPGATLLTLLCGWLFGFPAGLVLVSFASTAGAAFAFLLSRYLFREPLQQKFGERLQTFDAALERQGPFYLFMLRVVPLFPFFVINAVMGLTPIRMRTFWWVSQLGMLPGTAVYVYAGSSVPTLSELGEKGIRSIVSTELVFAFVFLGIFPLFSKAVFDRFAPKLVADAESAREPLVSDIDDQTVASIVSSGKTP